MDVVRTLLRDDVAGARHQLGQVVLGGLERALQGGQRVGRREAEGVGEALRVPGVLEDDHRHRAKGLLDPGPAHGGGGRDDVDLEPGRLVLVRSEQRVERLVEDLVRGVDGDEAGHLVGVRAGVEPTQQTAERVADEDIGTRDAGGSRAGRAGRRRSRRRGAAAAPGRCGWAAPWPAPSRVGRRRIPGCSGPPRASRGSGGSRAAGDSTRRHCRRRRTPAPRWATHGHDTRGTAVGRRRSPPAPRSRRRGPRRQRCCPPWLGSVPSRRRPVPAPPSVPRRRAPPLRRGSIPDVERPPSVQTSRTTASGHRPWSVPGMFSLPSGPGHRLPSRCRPRRGRRTSRLRRASRRRPAAGPASRSSRPRPRGRRPRPC